MLSTGDRLSVAVVGIPGLPRGVRDWADGGAVVCRGSIDAWQGMLSCQGIGISCRCTENIDRGCGYGLAFAKAEGSGPSGVDGFFV
jgi:hypothetical protein